MHESKAMLEIRKIRDESSQRRLNMGDEEINKELDDSMKRFIEEMARRGKKVEVVAPDDSKSKTA